jgi:hypothetical protein
MSCQPIHVVVEYPSPPSETDSVVGATRESAAITSKPMLLEESISNPPQTVRQVDGGDQEDFFQVSHLASIEVNPVARTPQPRAGMRRKPARLRTMETSTTSFRSSPVEEYPKEKQEEEEKGMSEQDDTTPEADVIYSDTPPEKPIEKSPYESEFDAEEGEPPFLDMKNILEENINGRPKDIAVELFGSLIASRLTRSAALIDRTGMLYSHDWIQGKFRDTLVGTIPTDLLLLCLVPSRFVKAGDLLLSAICKDIDVFHLVSNAIDEWGLQQEFKLVRPFFAILKCWMISRRSYLAMSLR